MKRYSFLIVLVLSVMGIFAQTDLPKDCSVALPRVLLKSLLKDQDIQNFLKSPNWGQDSKSFMYWKAYSDRSHNVTYNAPSVNAEAYCELAFNEEVVIAKIEGDFALVYSEKKAAIKYPKISSEAQSRGWIPMKNLLLWRSCPTDDAGVYKKVLIAHNLDILPNLGQNKDINYYMNPNTKDSPKELSSDMKFYFVMKQTEDGYVLLANDCNLWRSNSELFGWVKTGSFIPFNHRIFLEPNWNPEVAEKLKGTFVYVYRDDKIMAAIPLGQENTITKNESDKYRLGPDFMRLPLLGSKQDKDNQYQVIAFISSGMANIPLVRVRSRQIFLNDCEFELPQEKFLKAVYGYVDKNDSITGLDYWKPVLFITGDELASLLGTLKGVYNGASTGSRKAYVDSMKKLIQTILSDITDEEMSKKDIKDVMNLVTGLIVKTKSLSSHSIREIQDEKIVPQKQFETIIADFKDKYETLSQIHSTDYEFSVVVQGVRWYWLPMEALS